jgi:hypothetical protein
VTDAFVALGATLASSAALFVSLTVDKLRTLPSTARADVAAWTQRVFALARSSSGSGAGAAGVAAETLALAAGTLAANPATEDPASVCDHYQSALTSKVGGAAACTHLFERAKNPP